jgi:hypothetical protein
MLASCCGVQAHIGGLLLRRLLLCLRCQAVRRIFRIAGCRNRCSGNGRLGGVKSLERDGTAWNCAELDGPETEMVTG